MSYKDKYIKMRELRFKPKRFKYVHAYYDTGILYKMTEQLYPESEVVWLHGIGNEYWSSIKFKTFDDFLKWKREDDEYRERNKKQSKSYE